MKNFELHFIKTRNILKPNSTRVAFAGIAVSVGILFLQNLVIFFKHYFLNYGFPWDFPTGYYPVVAFWTSLVSQGHVPTWIPFQQMGYPMDLLIQSGIHYPLFWVFPIFKIPYTLNAAVVFQCLHVWFGTVGMFLFLRLVFKSNSYALLGAFCFQFFGGFYSNSEHADIIRSFALTPWLFYCFYIELSNRKISWRHFFIPVVILLLATGGYPGNMISGFLIMGVFVLLQIAQLLFLKISIKELLPLSIFIFTMTLIGIGISFYHLAPGWLYRNYLIRSEINISYNALDSGYIPGLFLNNDIFSSEISMSSAYITLPIVMLLAYVPVKVLKHWWALGLSCILSMFMVAGPASIVWYLITKLIPYLRISRFPSSDYRLLIIIPFILFAVSGARAILEHEITVKRFIVSTIFIILFIAQLTYHSYLPLHKIDWLKITPFVQAIEMLGLTSLILLIYYFIPSRSLSLMYVGLGILIVLITLDAVRVLPNMKTWQAPDFSTVYQDRKWVLLDENSNLLTFKLLENTPAQRPARVRKATKYDFSWEGYITGRYIVNDKVPYILKSTYIVDTDPVYQEFMEKPWTPLLFEPGTIEENNLSIPPADFSLANGSSNALISNYVKQTTYGINEIYYEVSLDRPQILVENEIYFPGWNAILDDGISTTEIKAFSTNGVFRSWALPAGNYQMLATFKFPNSGIFLGISVVAFVIWILVGLLRLRRKNNNLV